ncbi:flagellar FliJ protein [Lachnospiraceae bacterium C7]|nr:flagellar FliJ protein [Lachnospiraceae bacterium C7]
MAKFVYSMQNVLEIKKKLETQAKLAFSQANNKYLQEQANLMELQLKKTEYDDLLKTELEGNIDVKKVTVARKNVNTMKTLIRYQSMEVVKAKKKLEEEREKLQQIMQERKTHELLREKAFEEFKKEIAREEAKEIDGLISFTYSGNNKGEG